ncbi:DUF58 domain-containing protein [Brevibacillus sp. SYSU BS000544]|uniref:DUF58 domain-containing protein n=1 Tax=Brevibacillus sp. SYSU BS000544 TaxID=3416443 RepID=UPI003CE48C02
MKQRKYGKLKVIALLGLTYAFAKFQGGFASWFLFYSCITFFAYELLAYVLMFMTLQVTREIDRDRLQDGEDVIVTLRLKRKIWFPLGWNLVVESLPDKLLSQYEPHRQLVFPWFKREIQLTYVIPSLPRGYYRLENCVVNAGDFFGFIQRTKTFTLLNDFLVYPAYKQITHWPTGEGRISGNVQVTHRRSDDVSAVRGVRDYQRGDRLSQIHWRASARGMGLKTKEFEHQAMNQIVFFCDVNKDNYADKEKQLFEMAAKLTASLVYYASRRQYPFGFVSYQTERVAIPPGNTQTHFFRVFDQLARMMPEGEREFSQIVRREALEFPQGSTLAIVTPSLSKRMVAVLMDLASSGRKIHLFWIYEGQGIKVEEQQALQMLRAMKVECSSVHLHEYEELKQIGGA